MATIWYKPSLMRVQRKSDEGSPAVTLHLNVQASGHVKASIFHIPRKSIRVTRDGCESEMDVDEVFDRETFIKCWHGAEHSDMSLEDLASLSRINGPSSNKYRMFTDLFDNVTEIRTYPVIISGVEFVKEETWMCDAFGDFLAYTRTYVRQVRKDCVKWCLLQDGIYEYYSSPLPYEQRKKFIARREKRRRVAKHKRKRRGYGVLPRPRAKGPKPETYYKQADGTFSQENKRVKRQASVQDSYARVLADGAIVEQSDADERQEARRIRELQQRLAAKYRIRMVNKELPKREREDNVRSMRDKRNPAIVEQGLPDGVKKIAKFTGGFLLGRFIVKKGKQAVADSVRHIRYTLEPLVENIKKAFGKVLWSIVLGAIILWLLRKRNLNKYLLAAIPIAVGVYFKDDVGAFIQRILVRRIKKMLGKDDIVVGLVEPTDVPSADVAAALEAIGENGEIKEESFDNEDVSKAICGAFALSAFSGQPNKVGKESGEFLKRISLFERSSNGLQSFLKWIKDTFVRLIDFIRGKCNPNHAKALKEQRAPLKKWFDECDEQLKLHRTYDETGSPEEVNKIISLMALGHEFKTLYRGSPPYNDIVRMLAELTVILRPYSSSVAARNNTRFEPHMAVFVGEPGIGKTVLSLQVVSTVLVLSGLVKDVDSVDEVARQTWQKGTSDYWNGYCNQYAFIMDDVFQQRASTMDAENDYMNIIRAVSSWAFPLNMADLESKGRIYFNSKFIYATTNIRSIQSEAIKVVNSPEAVARRFKYAYQLILKDEYKKIDADGLRTNFLDRVRLDQEQRNRRALGKKGLDQFPFEWWDVAKHDFITGQTSSTRESLRDLIIVMARELRRSLDEHELSVQDLTEYIRNLREDAPVMQPTPPTSTLSTSSSEAVSVQPSSPSDLIGPVKSEVVSEITSVIEQSKLDDKFNREEATNFMRSNLAAAKWCPVVRDEQDRLTLYAQYRKTLYGRIPVFNKMIDDEAKNMLVTHKWADLLLSATLLASFAFYTLIIVAFVRAFKRSMKAKSEIWDGGSTYRGRSIDDYMNATRAHVQSVMERISKQISVNRPLEFDLEFYVDVSAGYSLVHIAYNFTDQEGLRRTYIESEGISEFKWFQKDAAGPRAGNFVFQSSYPERRPRVNHVEKGKIVLQSGNFSFDKVEKTQYDAVNGNVFGIIVVSKGKAIHHGNLLYVCDTLAVMPKHYTRQMSERVERGEFSRDDQVHIVNSRQNGFSFCVTIGQFIDLPQLCADDSDVRFVDFKQYSKRAARSIHNYFIRESDIPRYVGHAVRVDIPEYKPLDGPTFDDEGKPRQIYVHRRETSSKLSMVNNLLSKTGLARAWAYSKVHTEGGDCGSPIMIVDPTCASGKILLGYHVAANTRVVEGYGAVVTHEMVKQAMDKFTIVEDCFVSDMATRGFDIEEQSVPFAEGTSFGVIGEIKDAYNSAKRSSYRIVPECYGMFGEYNYFPAKLGCFTVDEQLINPMRNAIKPYGTPLVTVSTEGLKNVVHVAMSRFSQETMDFSRNDLTFEEAVLGDPMIKLRSIPRGTSAGFPHSLHNAKGKVDFFGSGMDYDLTSKECEELRTRVNFVLSEAAQGRRLSHVFVDFLKDELRKKEKVEAGLTRLISCSPLDYTVAVRIKFGRIMSAMFRTFIRSGMCPGMCAYTDWTELYNHLRSRGNKIFDGDFKSFDSSLVPEVLERICDWINSWYDDGEINARVRRVLFLDLVHSRHLGGFERQNVIYQWNKSLPSGHPLTTMVNSMYCLVALVAVYKLKVGDVTTFWDNVAPATYGDDNVCNISDRVCEKFNQATVSAGMYELFGMTYTSGQKDGKLMNYTSIENVTFLQRSFRLENGVVYSPLNLDSFLYTCYWCKNHMLKDQILLDNMEFALVELSQHEPVYWDHYAPIILGWLKERGVVTRLAPERCAYQEYMRTLNDNWF